MAVRLAGRLGGRDNNLNLLRILAAVGVLVSHAFVLTGSTDPLLPLAGETIGHFALVIFFAISGFLIARSFTRRATVWHWLTARVLRIFPGLLAVLLLSALVLGPLVTSLPLAEYMRDPESWTYVPRNLSLALLQYPLPGVFAENPYGPAVNGSLWTLFYEAVCYAGVLVAGLFGLLERRWAMLALLVVFIAGYAAFLVVDNAGLSIGALGYRLARLLPLALPFVLGMVVHAWRDAVVLDWRLAALLWLLAWPASYTPVYGEWLVLALGYTVLTFAFLPRGALLHYNRMGDFSYGTYLYAFPCQQLAIWLLPDQGWATNIAISLPAALLLGALSWRLVERPSLARVGSLAEKLVTRRAPPLKEER